MSSPPPTAPDPPAAPTLDGPALAAAVTLLDPVDAATLVELGEVGLATSPPILVVDLGRADGPLDPGARRALAGAPAVVVGVGDGSGALDPTCAAAVDVVLAPIEEEGAAADVVVVDDLDAELVRLTAAVAASPAAAVALVQLLRAGTALDLDAAVVAESWVYSLLQAGPVHRAWLASAARRPRGDDPERVVLVAHGEDRLDVVLHRPAARNAVSARLRDELVDALLVASADPDLDVHLWGAGPSFCTGGDLGEFGSAPDPATAHLVRTTRSPARRLAALGPRLTAHVHGASVGAGLEWAAFAHRVVARDDATFRLPELAMGLVPGAGGTASLPRRVGRSRTAWLALTGAELDVDRARRWGLVDEVVDHAAWSPSPT